VSVCKWILCIQYSRSDSPWCASDHFFTWVFLLYLYFLAGLLNGHSCVYTTWRSVNDRPVLCPNAPPHNITSSTGPPTCSKLRRFPLGLHIHLRAFPAWVLTSHPTEHLCALPSPSAPEHPTKCVAYLLGPPPPQLGQHSLSS
jgi:hypothetical protein